MYYTKPALSFEEQAQRLLDRGLIVNDKQFLVNCLSNVNYYRLSAYWYTFKTIDHQTQEERFVPGTSFEIIWNRYTFDRELRLLLMDAIEYVEVAILRTQMVELFTRLHGPFGYCDIKNFNPGFQNNEHQELLNQVDGAVLRSREEFVTRFQNKYKLELRLPLWMAVELMTFGQLFTIFRSLHQVEQQSLSRRYNLFPPVFGSWLHTINYIRNACAHHARLWNRDIPVSPKLPDRKNNPDFYGPTKINNKQIFAVLTLLNHLLSFIAPSSNWPEHIIKLLNTYPNIPINWMGFPVNWQDNPLWKYHSK